MVNKNNLGSSEYCSNNKRQSINQTYKIKVKLQEGLPFKNLKSKNNPLFKKINAINCVTLDCKLDLYFFYTKV